MPPLLFAISLSAIFSLGSLAVILFRVSPLTAPEFALPFLFTTLFLSTASVGSLACFGVWRFIPVEGLDIGRKLSASLREGVFLAVATSLLLLFHLLGILTWWIALLIYGVFLLIEVALHV